MKILGKKTVGLLIVSILLTFGTVALAAEQVEPYKETGTTPGYGTRVQYYDIPEGYPKFEDRTRFIGNLRGTWHEMGIQYGERAGDLIRYASDAIWLTLTKKYLPKNLKEDIDRYAKAVDDLSPKMTEFLKGIAKGASEELAKSSYKGKWSDFQRIILCNCFKSIEWYRDRFYPFPKKSSMQISPKPNEFGIACTGMALCGKSKLTPQGLLLSPTKNGETIITQNMDIGSFYPWGWNVAYVATPSDPEANVFWSISTAGMAGGNNLIVNEKGVALGLYSGQWKDHPKEFTDLPDFGITWQPLYVYTIAYADNAKEAIELLTLGTPEYRARTGRKILTRDRGWGYMVADPDEVAMVEVTAHRYAVRYPGDMDEAGNYVVFGNWHGSKYYFDENNVRHPVPPPLNKISEGKLARYYALDWHLRHHLGEVDLDMAKEMTGIRWHYDRKTGRRLDLAEDGRTPIYLKKDTPCGYGFGKNVGANIGGTMWSSCALLKKNGKSQIWWTKGRPCEWLGPWDHIDFAGYLR